MTIDLTQIILGVITILFGVLMKYIIPLIQNKIATEEARGRELQAELIRTAIRTMVYAAEQIYKSDQGTQKKAWVVEQLRLQGFDVDEIAIEAAIEAAVKELKIELSK